MAVVVPAPPVLARDLALFHTTDPLLSNAPLLIFHGPSATLGPASSRIQIHIFTPAGTASYPRLAVSPNSPLYSAVSNLPREEQGDEVIRGLAFGLKKYFEELPPRVRATWCEQAKAPVPSKLFGDDHVAILASRMTRIENVDEVAGILEQAFGEQRQSWQDVDVVLPPGAVKRTVGQSDALAAVELTSDQLLDEKYGRYAAVVGALGDAAFLPTSRLKRAPSKASSIGRSASFLRQQKENARKEICELMNTECNYVERMKDLSGLASTIGADSKESTRESVRKVFPDTIPAILEINAGFCEALGVIVEGSEDASLQSIEASDTEPRSPSQQDMMADPHGIIAVAKCLCDWLPQFTDIYRSYLDTHAAAAHMLRSLLRGSDTSIATELHEIGEQKLTSLLIEPVQRLPRYALYIDGIMKQLPVRHPALKHLLRAKDIVTEICSQGQDATTETARILERLSHRVAEWPVDVQVSGRLVTIVDVEELHPPFCVGHCEAHPGLLLLFSDTIVLLGKKLHTSLTARALFTELESNFPIAHESIAESERELHFLKRVRLGSSECTEGDRGRLLHLLNHIEELDVSKQHCEAIVESYYTLRLDGAYDGKAAKLAEEVVKAKVEGRYSEAERESTQWEVRASDPAADHASLFSAIFDNSQPEHLESRVGRASTRVLIDIDKHSDRPRAGQDGIRTVVALSPMKDGTWRLTIDSIDGQASREHITLSELAMTISRRLAVLSQNRFASSSQVMAACLLTRNNLALDSIELDVRSEEGLAKPIATQERAKRPKSPVKLLSSLLSGSGHASSAPRKDALTFPPPSLTPASSSTLSTKPPSRESRPSSRDHATPRSVVSARSAEDLTGSGAAKLESTLSTYLLALHARKGNIVGRSLKMRGHADELAVNELYNSLLEDPNLMSAAAQASVDVLFAGFEKFINVAWKNAMGTIIPFRLLQEVQEKAENLFPADFDEYFRKSMALLPPRNQRAFKNVLKLLADLLDGTGNDGDRGLLTAAFAEVLITDGDPRDFIALIDRFVDDTDTYFGEPVGDTPKPKSASLNAHKRSRSVNSASLTSNTSSLRKKFGLSTIGRANSKVEDESRVASVWRTLSKSTRGDTSPGPGGSLTRASFHRAHSSELEAKAMPRTPSSQERAPFLSLSGMDDGSPQPLMSSQPLKSIGEHPSFIPTGPPRKKRRSSLSDLHILDNAIKSSPASAQRPTLHTHVSEDHSLLPLMVPSTPRASSPWLGSPTKPSARSRLPSSFRRDSPDRTHQAHAGEARSQDEQKVDEVIITARPPSGIPLLTPRSNSPTKATSLGVQRNGLSERPGAGNIVKRPNSPSSKIALPQTPSAPSGPSPRKLRMQSPQKLRERLQNEQSGISDAHNTLQEELSRLGDEIAATPNRAMGSLRTSKTLGGHSRGQSLGGTGMELAQRVLRMEGLLPKSVEGLHARIDEVRADLASSLAVSEAKCKRLDELYRDANGENEALYARFNDELGRILRVVKGGEGVEELKQKLKESQDEAARLRRDVSRLKRENAGLRAQMRE